MRKRKMNSVVVNFDCPDFIPMVNPFVVNLTLQNIGTETWLRGNGDTTTAGNFVLSTTLPNDDMTWGINRWVLPFDVAPTQQVGFSLTLTPPTPAPHIAQALLSLQM